MELQPADLRIIGALQANSQISNSDLAEKAGMSASACWRRVKMLEKEGAIQRYTIQIDPDACGLHFHAILHIQLTRHLHEHVENFITSIKSRPEVQDCFATTGEADYHLRILCRDQAAYNEFLEGFLFKQQGIANIRTNLVLRDIKQSTALAL